MRTAKDMVDSRIRYAEAQSAIFGSAIKKLQDDIESPDVLVLARRLLREYHKQLKATARDER